MTNFQKKFELFLGKENFSKKLWLITTAVVPQHLDVKDTEKSRIIFHHYQHAKINLYNSPNHLWDTPGFTVSHL